MPRGVGRSGEAKHQRRLWQPSDLLNPPLAGINAQLVIYDSSNIGAIQLDSTPRVQTWRDQSGFGNDGTSSAAGERPLYSENILNGIPGANFDAARICTFGTAITNQYRSFAFLFQQNNSATTRVLLSGAATGPEMYLSTGHALLLDRKGVTNVITSAALSLGWHILVMTVQSTNGTAMEIDGVAQTPVNAITPTGDNTNFGSQNGGANHFNGGLPYVIAQSSSTLGGVWSKATRDRIAGFIAWKYWPNGDNLLVGTHPYKVTPPLIGT